MTNSAYSQSFAEDVEGNESLPRVSNGPTTGLPIQNAELSADEYTSNFSDSTSISPSRLPRKCNTSTELLTSPKKSKKEFAVDVRYFPAIVEDEEAVAAAHILVNLSRDRNYRITDSDTLELVHKPAVDHPVEVIDTEGSDEPRSAPHPTTTPQGVGRPKLIIPAHIAIRNSSSSEMGSNELRGPSASPKTEVEIMSSSPIEVDTDSSCIEVGPSAQLLKLRNSGTVYKQPSTARAPSLSKSAAHLDDGFMPSADNGFKFMYNSPSGNTAAELDQLVKPPARPKRDPRDVASLKHHRIKPSFTQLGTMPAPGLAAKPVAYMDEDCGVEAASDEDEE